MPQGPRKATVMEAPLPIRAGMVRAVAETDRPPLPLASPAPVAALKSKMKSPGWSRSLRRSTWVGAVMILEMRSRSPLLVLMGTMGGSMSSMLGEVRDWWDEGALGAARAEPARRSIDRNCMLMVVIVVVDV